MPTFYFPNGKPIAQSTIKEHNEALDKAFGPLSAKKSISVKDFKSVTVEVFKLPSIFTEMLHNRIEKVVKVGVTKTNGVTTLSREAISAFWEIKDYHRKTVKRRLFEVIKQENV